MPGPAGRQKNNSDVALSFATSLCFRSTTSSVAVEETTSWQYSVRLAGPGVGCSSPFGPRYSSNASCSVYVFTSAPGRCRVEDHPERPRLAALLLRASGHLRCYKRPLRFAADVALRKAPLVCLAAALNAKTAQLVVPVRRLLASGCVGDSLAMARWGSGASLAQRGFFCPCGLHLGVLFFLTSKQPKQTTISKNSSLIYEILSEKTR